ncbi:RimK family alpha-L-glutamate ligase [Virgibacillus xinjiangensis]|uniref:RimK family alpha-L-glutamate ligase n=1 Tax=Virgibacillus xinjiangensis TaxID=393090 RepID=A0ABV7CVA1_9BACI
MNLHGWIIYNGNLPGDKFLDFAQWIHEAASRKNSKTVIYQNNELLSLLDASKLDILGHSTAPLPDYAVFADKDIYLARQLELLGIRVFNSSAAIERSDDKIASYQQLASQHIPMPKTIVSPKIFSTGTIGEEITRHAVEELGFPLIIKEAYGSFGEQVYLITNETELYQKANELAGTAFMFQEFISSSYGRDLRLHVVGNRVAAAMKRQSKNDFRANITAGGTMEPYQPTDYEVELAVSAAACIGADIAGVDLLFGPDGSPLVCEINSNAHIRNLYECTGINVAENIIDYILEKLSQQEGGTR